ncbi:unnamed protein product [Scytosiphon promiscuus]
MEETVVRDKAVESACVVIGLMQGGQQEVADMVTRLSTGDWFTAKVSACGLFTAAYKHISEHDQRTLLRAQFDVLAKDTDTPMVRRAVASNVGDFAGVVEGHLLLSDVVPVFEALASDDQDNVRLLAVEQAGKVAKALVDQQLEDECAAHIVPVIKHAVEDRSWRVRCAMARGFAKAAHAVGPKLTTVELLPCLTSLLQDHETEVRAATIKDISSFVDLVGSPTFANEVMPYVLALLQDVNLNVRVALSNACMKLAPKLGQEHTMTHILPMLLAFLRDESAEVRLHILLQLDGLAEWMPAMAEQVSGNRPGCQKVEASQEGLYSSVDFARLLKYQGMPPLQSLKKTRHNDICPIAFFRWVEDEQSVAEKRLMQCDAVFFPVGGFTTRCPRASAIQNGPQSSSSQP